MEGQINLKEWQKSINHKVYAGCSGCACRNCLYWWSSRCPYGECWDDHRAIIDPYDKAHPDQPLRTAWSNWNKPGEQAYWCREAAEKEKPKPCEFYGDEEDGKLLCPNCGEDLYDLQDCGFCNCPYCGQAVTL